MALMFGTAGLPHILMRFFTVPDAKEARKSVFWATTWIGYFYILTFIIGFGAIVLVGTNPQFLDDKGGLIGGGNMGLNHLLGDGQAQAVARLFVPVPPTPVFPETDEGIEYGFEGGLRYARAVVRHLHHQPVPFPASLDPHLRTIEGVADGVADYVFKGPQQQFGATGNGHETPPGQSAFHHQPFPEIVFLGGEKQEGQPAIEPVPAQHHQGVFDGSHRGTEADARRIDVAQDAEGKQGVLLQGFRQFHAHQRPQGRCRLERGPGPARLDPSPGRPSLGGGAGVPDHRTEETAPHRLTGRVPAA